MTHHELGTILLGNFSPEERTIPDDSTYPGRNSSVMAAINGALQESYTRSPVWVHHADFGVNLHEPTAVTVAVTADSADATITGYETWMEGCEIVIAGHDIDNRILEVVDAGTGEVTLLFPYGSTTGSKTATVYHSSISIPDTVMKVLKPVRVDNVEISPVSNPDAYGTSTFGDFSSNPRQNLIPRNVRVADTVGKITGYKVESHHVYLTATPSMRMRLMPAPEDDGTLTYRATMLPPFVTDLTSTSEFPIPHQFVESVLLPMALLRLSRSPFFRNEVAIAGITAGYQQALLDLDSLSPQEDNEKKMRPIYG